MVQDVRAVADGVVSVEFAAEDGRLFAPWEPGAHVELALPSGRIRPYSLCGDPTDRQTYRIAVHHDPAGRGESAEARTLRAGRRVAVSRPRSRFPLVLAEHYLFIAGGIGITAILPMVRAVEAADREWSLLYGGRSRTSMAFTGDLLALDGDRVELVPQDTCGLPDLAAALARTPPGAAVYCCGPEPLIAAVERLMAADFPDRHLHTECFGAPPQTPTTAARDFHVELRRSGRVLPVPADRTLLDVVREAVPGAQASCEAGFCGTCELRVLEGVPDHRDTVLTGRARERRDVIYPCVSRAVSPRLVVDL
ncbi:oxidoreductase [Streptomyces sp. ISL-43]|nr:oxidoreductase [Streptomyces sp. ISL-43]